MALLLAIEASTDLGSVAVGTSVGEVLDSVNIAQRRHSTEMANALGELIRGAGASWHDVQGIVVGDGPGSFTGLRIAFATAQGLKQGSPHLELHAIPSLMAAAFRGHRTGAHTVAALFDALRGDVFAAIYRFGDRTVETLLEPGVIQPEELTRNPAPDLCTGDGAVKYGEAMARWSGREPLGPPAGGPDAAQLLQLAAIPGTSRLLGKNPEPRYGRLPAAQVRWEETSGKRLPHTTGPGR